MEKTDACIVQRDFTVLLEVGHPGFDQARAQLGMYAELVKTPAAFHTYRITALSLWNAAALGWSADQVIESLESVSRWNVPAALIQDIQRIIHQYGKLQLKPQADHGRMRLVSEDERLLDELSSMKTISAFRMERVDPHELILGGEQRGLLKRELTRLGYPVLDYAGYREGTSLPFEWQANTQSDSSEGFRLRPYQRDAVDAFEGSEGMGGSGLLVLPCGAGKTVIGMAVLERLQCECLILTSNTTSVRQWIQELQDKTTITSEQIGEYSGQKKQVKPVTVATYQILTHRKSKDADFTHIKLLSERQWGLIIYDEVHLLPAPVFRATADIQATRRLGLTATLVREDGCEQDVFSLIGPKLYDMPWKELEQQGWIANVQCQEIRIPFTPELRSNYLEAEVKHQFRLAAENPAKLAVIRRILDHHEGMPALVIGQYLDQLESIAREIEAPLISGTMSQQERVKWFAAFRRGEIKTIVVSKVANFAVDLPDAAVALEISGSFGSRQEEAQRLGRILRPKSGENKAYFYALVSEDSKEQEFALRRQMFLVEQGYEYKIVHELQ
ncbi:MULTISPECIES: DNA repair helicase XPB [unclassified Paenibacillus]|uniref:DNA repair helicase XPB n=1 Tax=unclassified Paenibacillus TaxID=185978 RepID=UPI0009A56FBF|nr:MULTISPECIES: DNA repair helicase XPB [unclassified Paenibacillus]SLJ92452.1 DNA excision repair protein ERCC-3 [Paenibacillus sp. RU5A]SOC58593.1 DNA excision repair protein ERCC-3 [Paenibacillus sp. RU26A]SOC67645.1 DNA excision repair protein ERCC-3 [Paenibacillus sp. RU5M]